MLALSLFSFVSIAIGFLAVLLGALNFYFQHLRRRSALLVKCLPSNQAPGHTTTALALCNTGNTQVMVSHIGFALRAPDGQVQQEIATAINQPAFPFTLHPGEIRSLLAWSNQPIERTNPRFARQVHDPADGPLRVFDILVTISCLAVDGGVTSVTEHFATRCYRGDQFIRATGRSFDVTLFRRP